ncbi:MAG: FtsK/SpoIIIE domain-containing protein [Ilumatobacteraceae bacterium]
MDLICTWLTGPDSGAEQRITWHPGSDGTTFTAVIGSAGHFRCDDPSLQAHHVAIEARALLETDGTPPTAAQLWVTQLAGTADVHAHDGALRGRTAAGGSVLLAVGSSTCRVDVAPTAHRSDGQHRAGPSRPEPRDADLPGDGHTRPLTLVRVARRIPSADELAVAQHLERVVERGAARAAVHHDDEPPAVPERERPGGLVPTLVGLGGSAVIAVVTGRPMFLLFGALGGLVALTSWVAQWIAFRRRHRRAVDAHRLRISSRAADRTAARHRDRATIEAVTPAIAAARSAITTRSPMLWACRSRDPDAFLVGLGIGDIRRGGGAAGDDMLVDVPVPAWLGPGERLALLGPGADGLARSLVVQLASRCGPADLRLVVDADDWRWATRLPHILRPESALADGRSAADDIAAFARRLPSTHLVVVTTNMAALGVPASSLRHLLDHTPAALIAIGDGGIAPSGTTALLDTRSHPAVFTPDVRHSPIALPLRPSGIGAAAAAACAAALEPLRDPEVLPEVAQQLPAAVDLDDLLGARSLEPAEIAAEWSRPGTSLRLPLGLSDRHGISTGHDIANGYGNVDDAGETAWLDLVADGPHALVAGTTGSGKSELLRSMVVGLARCASPQQLSMVLVDFKGGATFDLFAALPHVAAVITDLDDHLADRMLRNLRAEMRARETLLRRIGEPDIDAARVRGGPDVPPRLVVIVDEFAALVGERPSFMHALVGIAQRGRSLGLHLVLATQRPAGVVSDDIRANTAVRIALRLHDRSDAVDVVGDDAPTSFPRRAPGRAMLRDGDRCIVVQTARCARPNAAIDAIARAASIVGCGPARPPWMAPLPERLDELPAGLADAAAHCSGPTATTAIGIVDDPDHQRYLPLGVPRGALGLVVAGSRGMGVSSTLATVAAAAAAHFDRVIVIEADSAGGVWHPLDESGIVERLGADDDRLLRIMRRDVDTRGPLQRERTLVILDGIEMLRRALGTPAHDHRVEHRHESRFDQLLGALLHPDALLDVAIGTAEPGTIPAQLLARCNERWLLHLADPSSAAALGVSPRIMPPPIPGRLVVAGIEAQVLAPPVRVRLDAPPRNGRRRFESVPEQLDLESIMRDARHASTPHGVVPTDAVPVGIDLETGRIAGLAVQAGDTIVIAGPRHADRVDIASSVASAIECARPTHRVRHVDLADIAAVGSDTVASTRVPEQRTHLSPAEIAPTDIAPTDIMVVSGTGHDLRRREGWWTSRVRRARAGIIVASRDAATDGELLGVVLPRGFPASSHPQRGWLVDHGTIAPVQVARRSPAPSRAQAHAQAPTTISEWPLPLGAAWRPLSGTRR